MLHERAKAMQRHEAVAAIRWKELHNSTILVLNPEARNPLSAIHIIRPHRDAMNTRNARQEAGERLYLLILVNDEPAFMIKIIFHGHTSPHCSSALAAMTRLIQYALCFGVRCCVP
ncbi:hypothetical protein D1872_260480 [compost metagenome]